MGCAMPQARFCTAIAMPHASRLMPRSPVIGRVNRPKLARTPLVAAATTQPAMMMRRSGTAGVRAAVMADIGHPELGALSSAARRSRQAHLADRSDQL